MAVFVVFSILLILTLPVSHLIASQLSGRLDVQPGHAREVMPALPASPPVTGRAEKRWDSQIRKLERKLLVDFAQGAQGVEAHALASQYGVDVAIAEATLAKIREEIPCRLQITAQGRMLHDFSTQNIEQLKSMRRKAMPMQVLLFVLGAFANLGAAWPFLTMLSIAGLSLLGMASEASSDGMLVVGVMGLVATALVFGVNFLSGIIAHWILSPARNGPKLGPVAEGESAPQRLKAAPMGRTNAADDGIFWLWAADSTAHSVSHSSGSIFGGHSTSGGGGFDFDFDGDDASGILVVIVVVLLLAVVAACLGAIWVWLRGIWRAIKRLDEPQKDMSPTVWVRTADKIDKWERMVPTNDLVLRAIHALKRAFERRRAQDDDLPARIMVLARHYGGKVSALQIALQEGLDLDEATEVGSRLTGLLGGQIMVSDYGELVFSFPDHLLGQVIAKPDDDMWSEFIEFDAHGTPIRRALQKDNTVPVNLVGFTLGHLKASSRLVSGTFLMALTGGALSTMALADPATPMALKVVGVLAMGFLLMMVFGATTLGAVTRYATKSLASNGVYRDIRRATYKTIQVALAKQQPHVDVSHLPRTLKGVFGKAWSKLDIADIHKEVLAACADLDLQPDMDYISSHPDSRDVYDLRPLYQKFQSARSVESVFDDAQDVTFDLSQDEVIFDTQIEHNHVSVLGQV